MTNDSRNIHPASQMCIFGERICKSWAVAPFAVNFSLFVGFFLFWVIALTVIQTWQIAINQTSNEASNYFRLDYFFIETFAQGLSSPAGENEPEEEEFDHPIEKARPGTKLKFANPFDRGAWLNLYNFCMNRLDEEAIDSPFELFRKQRRDTKKQHLARKPSVTIV